MQNLFTRFVCQCLPVLYLMVGTGLTAAAQQPAISGFSPTSGLAGTSVIITGSNFSGATSVVFRNTTASTFTVNSPTQITAVVPVGALTGTIKVATPNGVGNSTPSVFTVPTPPTISSFTPAEGPVGAQVRINGTFLTNASSVTFNGVPVAPGGFTVNATGRQINATVPAGATTGVIQVTTPNGTATSSSDYVVTALGPIITGLSATSGATGSAVTITGSGFTGPLTVRFNGVLATVGPFTATSISTTVPGGATTGPITVENADGTAISGTDYTVTDTNTNPTISNIPSQRNCANSTVIIGFTVSDAQTPAADLVVTATSPDLGTILSEVSPGGTTGTRNVLLVPNATTGGSTTVTVTVTDNSGGTFDRTFNLTIDPIITVVAGPDQTVPSNQPVVVSGTVTGTSQVLWTSSGTGTFTNAAASSTSYNPSTSDFVAGQVTLTLIATPAAGSTCSGVSSALTVDFLPVITSFSPTQGPIGTTVMLSGSGFSDVDGVSFNGVSTTFTINSPTSITTVVPNGATTGTIAVTAPSGASTSTTNFIVEQDLVISSGQTIPPGPYRNITVTGTGVGTLTGPVSVSGAFLIQSGGELIGSSGCNPISGAGAFTLEGGATLHVCHPQGITSSGPSGQIQVTGARSFSGAANYIYDGSGSQMSGAGLPAVLTGTLTINNAAGVDLSQNVGIRRVVELIDGSLRQGDGSLTIMSDASGTGMVVNENGEVTGSATVQRYISTQFSSAVGYHHLSPPVTNTNVLDLATTGFAPVVNPLYNTTPNPQFFVRPYPTVFGYDETRQPTVNNFILGYFSPTTLGSALEWGRGYTVYISSGLTPDFVGTLGNGTMTRSGLTRTGSFIGASGRAGWHLLGNPYPSPIDWDRVTVPAGMSRSVSVWRATGTGQSGVYTVYTNGIGPLGTDLIGIAQGFFVRVTGAGPVNFTLTNACRVTDYVNVSVNRTAPQPQLGLTLAAQGAPADQHGEAYVYFDEEAQNGYDTDFDGARPDRNVDVPTLASLVDGEELGVNALNASALQNGARVALLVDVPTAGRYELTVSELSNLGTEVALYDALTGTTLPLTAESRYAFTTAKAGEQTNRFRLLFGNVTASAATESLTVYPNPAKATVRVAGATAAAVELVDALGRVVRTQTLTNGAEAMLNLMGIPAGVYTVRAGAQTTRLVVE